MKKWNYISFLSVLLLLVACNPMEKLYKDIRDYGYIVFKTPLAYAGPGTLVGGSPARLSLVASPETCFPSEIDGIPTNLYRVDHTVIPKRNYSMTVYGKVGIDLANFMSVGNPVLGAGIDYSIVQTTTLEMRGVHVEYLDSIRLTEFYNSQMSETCKEYLDSVGFIIQALKVEQLEFRFYNEHGVAIRLGLNNLESIVDLNLDVGYHIKDEVALVIDTPKYIGYQLGQLRKKDNGLALYRATRIKGDKFLFESLNVFSDKSMKKSRANLRAYEPSFDQLKDLNANDLIKNNSLYFRR